MREEMMNIGSLVDKYYGFGGIMEKIETGLNLAGKDVNSLTIDDLAPIDEFHTRGRESTLEVAEMAKLNASDLVLDVGCGLMLPAKSKIIQILGPSNRKKGDDNHLIYDYQLKNHDAIGRVAVIDIQFDRTAEHILRIKMKYLRYNLDADFEKGEAILNVDIFDDRKT